MDHTEAVRLKATEQYLLGDLHGDLRDQFEGHFMSCQECARDLRAGALFVGNIKEALVSETSLAAVPVRAGKREGWLTALFRPAVAAPALAVLLCIVCYQALVAIPRMRSELANANAPTSVSSFSLLSGSSRGEASVPVVVSRNQPFTLYVDVPPSPAFPLYTLEVQSAAGEFQFSLPVSADEARNTVEVLVPAGRLAAGDYVMVIRGASSDASAQGTEVGRVRFSLTYRN